LKFSYNLPAYVDCFWQNSTFLSSDFCFAFFNSLGEDIEKVKDRHNPL